MNNAARAKLFIVVISTVLLISSAIHAKQTGQQPSATQSKPEEQKPAGQQAAPETLQVLKGMPRQQIMGEMRKIATAMGAECNFCHIAPYPAETPRKAVARLMMKDYTMGMKRKDGNMLTCNDCHKGHARPLTVLPFARRQQQQQQPPPEKKPNG